MVGARLGELSRHLGGELIGDAEFTVSRIGPLESADAQTISFLANPRYQPQLAASLAGCVIVGPAMREAAAARGAAIVCADPYLAFAKLTQWWAAQQRRAPAMGVHPSAVVEEGARIDAGASIGALLGLFFGGLAMYVTLRHWPAITGGLLRDPPISSPQRRSLRPSA